MEVNYIKTAIQRILRNWIRSDLRIQKKYEIRNCLKI